MNKAEEIIDMLCNRKGFDDWFDGIDDDIQEEIIHEINLIIKPVNQEKFELLMLELYLYYTYTGGYGAGYGLHIVLDEGNLENTNIEFCRNYLPDEYQHIIDMLLDLDETERYYLIDKLYDYYSGIGMNDNKSDDYYKSLLRNEKINDILNV